jgi:hypothetical protein
MTKGASNREIAAKIFLSEETVKSHVKRILQKFGVASRGQAVATYLESLERHPASGGGDHRGCGYRGVGLECRLASLRSSWKPIFVSCMRGPDNHLLTAYTPTPYRSPTVQPAPCARYHIER